MKISDSYKHKTKAYIHCDFPVGHAKAQEIILSDVSKYRFMPFFGYNILVEKVKKLKKEEYRSLKADSPDGIIFFNDSKFLIKKIKKRPIKFASHTDACIYSNFACILEKYYEREILESGLNQVVCAYRKGRGSNYEIAAEAFSHIALNSSSIVATFDIKGFFDTIDHGILKNKTFDLLRKDKGKLCSNKEISSILKSLCHYSYIDLEAKINNEKTIRSFINERKSEGHKRAFEIDYFRNLCRNRNILRVNESSFGIPQGSASSAILSNIYLFEFDLKLKNLIEKNQGIYRRYSDDIFIAFPAHKDQLRYEIETFIITELEKLNLEIQKDKTYWYSLPNDFQTGHAIDYLGFTFNGKFIYIRTSSLNRYWSKMRSGVAYAKNRFRKYCEHNKPNGNKMYASRILKRYTCAIWKLSKNRNRLYYSENKNFITYAHSSHKVFCKRKIKSKIRKQVRNHVKIFNSIKCS